MSFFTPRVYRCIHLLSVVRMSGGASRWRPDSMHPLQLLALNVISCVDLSTGLRVNVVGGGGGGVGGAASNIANAGVMSLIVYDCGMRSCEVGLGNPVTLGAKARTPSPSTPPHPLSLYTPHPSPSTPPTPTPYYTNPTPVSQLIGPLAEAARRV